ncbi:MotA/TolQ/ExbB proton channel family protein [Ferrimonas gelatinilytica]|uniref:MotA/TolQ/ExbB proton channel family protein n=1 Tax=Ferrimonas gelatinilytica TaxID=1255257 RepID=A0ABP9RZQ8_9GAMM
MKRILLTGLLAMVAALPLHAETELTLDQLLDNVKAAQGSEAKINAQREANFTAVNADRKALKAEADRAFAEEQARGDRLAEEFLQGERELNELEKDLANATGNLGEMFGVVRQASGDLAASLDLSLISAQYPDRDRAMAALAEAKTLPTLDQLEALWLALQTEMTESAKIAQFETPVTNHLGQSAPQRVTRVGPFNLMANGEYLGYSAETGTLLELPRQPEGYKVATLKDYANGKPGEWVDLYIDPSRGSLLEMYTQKATLAEHFANGGVVGKIIAILLVIGLVLALWRMGVLIRESGKIAKQQQNLSEPGDNALGRIIAVYQANRHLDSDTLELKVDEAILKETPRIEMGISLIKVLAAIAPMLGLLGTVTGMIATFQNITLFGTGDPKIMAGGISMALVTTVMGLIAALPLLLMHALVASRAKAVLEVIDAQSTGLIAGHAERETR